MYPKLSVREPRRWSKAHPRRDLVARRIDSPDASRQELPWKVLTTGSWLGLLAALCAGGLIGLARSRRGRQAGFREHTLVCLAPMDRRTQSETREHRLFSFLTTEANDVVRPIHAKAMPVLLTTSEQWNVWLAGSIDEAKALQRPLPNHELRIVAEGEKSDGGLD